MQAGLAGAITERLERRHADAVYRADVDHARWVAFYGGGFEEGRYELRDGEDAGEVQGEHACPGCFGELVVGSAPVGAGVVDEDVQFGLVLLELVDHLLAV